MFPSVTSPTALVTLAKRKVTRAAIAANRAPTESMPSIRVSKRFMAMRYASCSLQEAHVALKCLVDHLAASTHHETRLVRDSRPH